MHQRFNQRARGSFGEVDHWTALRVPARRCSKATPTIQRLVVADSPQEHSGKHAFINLDQHLFDQAAASLGREHPQG